MLSMQGTTMSALHFYQPRRRVDKSDYSDDVVSTLTFIIQIL